MINSLLVYLTVASCAVTNVQYNNGQRNVYTEVNVPGVCAPYDYIFTPPVTNGFSHLPFVEMFETNTVTIGDINGQNNWEVSQPGTALVQTNDTYEGSQALSIASTNGENTTVRQLFANPGSDIVWADMYTKAYGGVDPTNIFDSSVCFYFNSKLHLMGYDGKLAGTNKWVILSQTNDWTYGDWVRLTTCLDYNLQEWSIYANDTLLAEGLGFVTTNSRLTMFEIAGQSSVLDNFTASTTMPTNLFF